MDPNIFSEWIRTGEFTIPRLLLMHYKDIGLTDEELLVIIQLKSYIDQGEKFPQISQIAERMHLNHDQVFTIIHQLIKKEVLQIQNVTDPDGKASDEYNLFWLYEKIYTYINQKQQKVKQESDHIQVKELYSLFEKEFGRPLSAIEIQTLHAWIDEDKYSPDLIYLALREAVLNQVYSLKYIDRILLNWEKKNLRTKDQVLKETKKYREMKEKQESQAAPKKNSIDVPLYNWLEEFDEPNQNS